MARLRIQTAAEGVNGFVKAIRWKTESKLECETHGDFHPACRDGRHPAPSDESMTSNRNFARQRDRKKPGELCGSRTFFGIAAKSRIPLVELVSEFFIQHSGPYLQEQMGAATTPAHLLLFDESLA
jgi:hypothetical protein